MNRNHLDIHKGSFYQVEGKKKIKNIPSHEYNIVEGANTGSEKYIWSSEKTSVAAATSLRAKRIEILLGFFLLIQASSPE